MWGTLLAESTGMLEWNIGEGDPGEGEVGTELFLSDIQMKFRNECILFTMYYFSPVCVFRVCMLKHSTDATYTHAQVQAYMPLLPDNIAACKCNIQILIILYHCFYS